MAFLRSAAVIQIVLVAAAATGVGQICAPHWSDSFPVGDFNGIVRIAAEWDEDGEGPLPPALYVGGDFTIAGGVPARHLAKWDGNAWSEVGGGAGVDTVLALVPWDDDGDGPNPAALYVGTSDLVTDSPFSGISRWDGSTWTSLGGGLHWDPIDGSDVFVKSIFILDEDGDGPQPPKLIAGGRYDFADGIKAEGIARWDGNHWEAMGHFQDVATFASFLNTGVQKLMMVDTDGPGPLPARLCAFGGVDNDTLSPSQSVVAWNGTEWEPAYRRLDDILTAAVFDTDGPGPLPESVIVGGTWTNHIARWNGSAWETLGPGLDGNVRDLQVVPTLEGSGLRLVASGNFSQRIVEWNGTGWSSIAPTPNQSVFAMLWTDDGQTLSAFGQFSAVGTVAANRVARFRDGAWSPIGSSDPGFGFHGAQPAVLRAFPNDGGATLYAAGLFNLLGTQSLRNVGRWDGRTWSELYGGTLSGALALERFDDDGPGPSPSALYIAGSFTVSAGGPADRIARWDGAAWHALAASPNSTVNALQNYDPDGDGPLPGQLIAAGSFTSIGGPSFTRIAAWSGTAWQSLEAGLSSPATVLKLHDPDGPGPLPALLVVGGNFVTAGTVTANGLGIWNGSTWATLPDHGFSSVTALTSHDPDGDGPAQSQLFVRGILAADGSSAIRMWDGSTWTTVLPPGFASVSATTWTRHDADGPGPQPAGLYGVGTISEDGVEFRSAVYRLTSDSLEVVALVDDDGAATTIESFDPDGNGPVLPFLCVGGTFDSLGGQSSEHFAVLLPPDLGCDCPQPSLSCSRSDCAPLEGDCIVNLNDLGAVLSGYAPGVSGKSRATGDIYPAPLGDGVVDLQDLGAILSDYGSDCR